MESTQLSRAEELFGHGPLKAERYLVGALLAAPSETWSPHSGAVSVRESNNRTKSSCVDIPASHAQATDMERVFLFCT